MKNINIYKLISKNLKKHNSNEITKSKMIINNLIETKKTHLVSLFKDYLIYDFKEEYLSRFYKRAESKEKLIKNIMHYKNYLLFYCKPTFSSSYVNKKLAMLSEKQAKLYYDKKYVHNKDSQKNSTKKNDSNSIKFNKLFTNSVIKEINNVEISFNNDKDDINEIKNKNIKKENNENSIYLPEDTDIKSNCIITKDDSINSIINEIEDYKNKEKKKSMKMLKNKKQDSVKLLDTFSERFERKFQDNLLSPQNMVFSSNRDLGSNKKIVIKLQKLKEPLKLDLYLKNSNFVSQIKQINNKISREKEMHKKSSSINSTINKLKFKCSNNNANLFMASTLNKNSSRNYNDVQSLNKFNTISNKMFNSPNRIGKSIKKINYYESCKIIDINSIKIKSPVNDIRKDKTYKVNAYKTMEKFKNLNRLIKIQGNFIQASTTDKLFNSPKVLSKKLKLKI